MNLKSLTKGSTLAALFAMVGVLACSGNPAAPRGQRVSRRTEQPAAKAKRHGPMTYYIANGFAKTATPEDARYGWSELRFFNPSSMTTNIRMTMYFEDRHPVELAEKRLKAQDNSLAMAFPKRSPELFGAGGPWGLKITSDTPLLVDHILGGGIEGPAADVRYQGGMSDELAKERASTVWYFGDGFEIKYADPAKAPFPFNELEWYHILNPNREKATVTMECLYHGAVGDVFKHEVEGERVKLISNHGLVKLNQPYGIKFTSTLPVVIQSERLIYGLNSIEEWGLHMHNSRPGVPGPIELSGETTPEN